MKPKGPLWLAALLAAAACGCSPAPPPSGAEGTVLLGPMCPGPVRQGQPCPDRPVARSFVALSAPPGYSGPLPGKLRVSARFASDAKGRFRVPLPPGHYIFYSQASTYFPCLARTDVPKGAFVKLAVHCDTGMR